MLTCPRGLFIEDIFISMGGTDQKFQNSGINFATIYGEGGCLKLENFHG